MNIPRSVSRQTVKSLKKKQKRIRTTDTLKLLVGILIIIGIILSMLDILDSKTYIYELNNRNLQLEERLEAAMVEINELNVKINMQTTISNIKTTAETEFGMIRPSSEQIIAKRVRKQYVLAPNKEHSQKTAREQANK